MRRPMLHNPILAPPPAPLTLRNARAELYHRLPAVESQLDELLGLPTHRALTERLAQPDRTSTTYVQEESVAYFLREWHRAEQPIARDWLVEQTLNRIDGFIHAHLYGLSGMDEENAYGDVLERVFRTLFDLASARGEYYQVRFWNALHRRCIDRYDHYHRREEAEQANRVRDPRDRDDGDVEDPASQVPDATVGVADRVISRDEARRIVQHLRDRVTPDQLEAYMLCKVDRWPIEGAKSPTLCERYGKTPKTINNWIHAVEDAIASLQGGAE